MKQSVFVDTSGWYALIDRKDPDHEMVSQCLLENEGRLITTNFVLDETVTLLRMRTGLKPATDFGEKLLQARIAKYIRLTLKDERRAWEIFRKYKNNQFSFTDCTSFAFMERMGLKLAVSLDDDFRAFGLRCLPG